MILDRFAGREIRGFYERMLGGHAYDGSTAHGKTLPAKGRQW